MTRIALMMLFGRPARYLAMVVSTSFAIVLITQQAAIFLGAIIKSTGPLQNIDDVDFWVTTHHTRFVDRSRGVNAKHIQRLQSISGVAWAKPFLQVEAIAELPDGGFLAVTVYGVDRATLIGRPPTMLVGQVGDLRSPETVLIENSGRQRLRGVQVGDVLRLNEQRARVVGICEAKTGILSKPILYATYENAVQFSRMSRNKTSWILVKAQANANLADLRREIEGRLGLEAVPADDLRWRSMEFIVFDTSIGISFLVTILLGFGIGLVISGATFGQFAAECVVHFAVLRAVGTRAATLVQMVTLQALTVGAVSYGIGLGVAALISLPGRSGASDLNTYFPWQMMVAALVPTIACMLVGSAVSLWRVFRVDPIVVFQ